MVVGGGAPWDVRWDRGSSLTGMMQPEQCVQMLSVEALPQGG